jgi:hypothetical protein
VDVRLRRITQHGKHSTWFSLRLAVAVGSCIAGPPYRVSAQAMGPQAKPLGTALQTGSGSAEVREDFDTGAGGKSRLGSGLGTTDQAGLPPRKPVTVRRSAPAAHSLRLGMLRRGPVCCGARRRRAIQSRDCTPRWRLSTPQVGQRHDEDRSPGRGANGQAVVGRMHRPGHSRKLGSWRRRPARIAHHHPVWRADWWRPPRLVRRVWLSSLIAGAPADINDRWLPRYLQPRSLSRVGRLLSRW